MNNFFRKTRRHFLACEDTAGGSQLSGGGSIFQLNKEELSLRATMDLVGPSRQALHIQSSSDDSHLLTMPRRAQQGGGQGRGPRLERPGDGEDAAVESQMERSGKLGWFWCAAALPPTGDRSKNRG